MTASARRVRWNSQPVRARPALFWFILLALALLSSGIACAPGQPQATASSSAATAEPAQPTRRLVLVAQAEPDSLAAKSLRPTGGRRINATLRLFNAGLAIHDDKDAEHPYLAEALPALNTDSWKVLPDGHTETTYRLRPGLTWQDAEPLTADDFLFAWHVYATPDLGVAATPPLSFLDAVSAPDDRTVVFHWSQPYMRGGYLEAEDFPPLPAHILRQAFEQDQPDAFVSQPFWGANYVGLGPYRVDRWELGSAVEGSAFDGHALGRPQIDRIRLQFMSDPNAVVASLLSGDVQATIDDAIRLQQAMVLKQAWDPQQAGEVLLSPAQVRHYQVQLKPEVASPAALRDLRVRRAIAHAIDRKTIADGLLEGQGIVAHTYMAPNVSYYSEIDRAITKYVYDPRLTEQLMEEAGYRKAEDGLYASPADGTFHLEVRLNAAGQNEAEGTAIADSLKRNGLDSGLYVIPQAQAADAQFRASFPGLTGTGNILSAEPPVTSFTQAQIPSPENRWHGSNRGGWTNADFERLVAAWQTTLDQDESHGLVVQMMKLMSEELPDIPMYYNLGVEAHVAALHGPLSSATTDGAVWNVQEWYWAR